jgi:hypothetical protein
MAKRRIFWGKKMRDGREEGCKGTDEEWKRGGR